MMCRKLQVYKRFQSKNLTKWFVMNKFQHDLRVQTVLSILYKHLLQLLKHPYIYIYTYIPSLRRAYCCYYKLYKFQLMSTNLIFFFSLSVDLSLVRYSKEQLEIWLNLRSIKPSTKSFAACW